MPNYIDVDRIQNDIEALVEANDNLTALCHKMLTRLGTDEYQTWRISSTYAARKDWSRVLLKWGSSSVLKALGTPTTGEPPTGEQNLTAQLQELVTDMLSTLGRSTVSIDHHVIANNWMGWRARYAEVTGHESLPGEEEVAFEIHTCGLCGEPIVGEPIEGKHPACATFATLIDDMWGHSNRVVRGVEQAHEHIDDLREKLNNASYIEGFRKLIDERVAKEQDNA